MGDYFSDKIGSPLILPVDLVAMTANTIDYTQRLHNIIYNDNLLLLYMKGFCYQKSANQLMLIRLSAVP